MSSYVIKLNNYLQKNGKHALLSWADSSSGPANALEWSVSCKYDGRIYGTGVARSKGEAKEIAARQALQALGGH